MKTEMKLCILLFSLVMVVQTKNINKQNVTTVCINDVYYDKIVLTPRFDWVDQLNIHLESDTLFFIEPIRPTDIPFYVFSPANGKVIQNISTTFGRSPSVDQKNKIVYIGTNNGLYTYNIQNNKFEYFALKGVVNIGHIQLKDDIIYYSNNGVLSSYHRGESKKFQPLEFSKVGLFCFDNDGDLIFRNITGLYLLKNGEKNALKFENIGWKALLWLTDIVPDLDNKIYAVFFNAIYRINKDKLKLELYADAEMLHLDKQIRRTDLYLWIRGLAFDRINNMIFGDTERFYKLVPNKDISNKKKKCEPLLRTKEV